MNRFIYLFLGGIFGIACTLLSDTQNVVYAVTNTGDVATGSVVTGEKLPTPKKNIVVATRPNLPEKINETQKVLIYGFPEESLANQLATRYYRESGRDMLLTMLGENGGFNHLIVSPTHDYGLCQLNYAASSPAQKDFINSEEFKDPQKQATYCIQKFNSAASKNIWVAYRSRWNHAWKITIVDVNTAQ